MQAPTNYREKSQVWKKYLDRHYGGDALREEVENLQINEEEKENNILREKIERALEENQQKHAEEQVKNSLYNMIC